MGDASCLVGFRSCGKRMPEPTRWFTDPFEIAPNIADLSLELEGQRGSHCHGYTLPRLCPLRVPGPVTAEVAGPVFV